MALLLPRRKRAIAIVLKRIAMETLWILTCHLNDTHSVSKWLSFEGAIANRDRQLEAKRIRFGGARTGYTYKFEYPTGWTSIQRSSNGQ